MKESQGYGYDIDTRAGNRERLGPHEIVLIYKIFYYPKFSVKCCCDENGVTERFRKRKRALSGKLGGVESRMTLGRGSMVDNYI